MKPQVLVIADVPNWAYFEIQQFVKEKLSDEFDIYCDFLSFNTIKKSKNPIKRLRALIDKYKYQRIRRDNNYDIVIYLGFYFDKHMKISFSSKKSVKGIYTDGFPPQNSNFKGSFKEFYKEFLNDIDAVVCGSEQIKSLYQENNVKSYYANSVLNEKLFLRLNKKELNQSSKFFVGWTGNPRREFKGFYSHVIPAVELAREKYPGIELITRFEGPMNSLPRFYDNIDVVVIASDADAGPSMFGEASLMEVPSISTGIGWPNQVIKPGINGIIVEKNIEIISSKIIELYENRRLLFDMSRSIRKDYLEVFNSERMADNWRVMLNELLNE